MIPSTYCQRWLSEGRMSFVPLIDVNFNGSPACNPRRNGMSYNRKAIVPASSGSNFEVAGFFLTEDVEDLSGGLKPQKPAAEFLLVHQTRDTAQELDVGSHEIFPSDEQKDEADRLVVKR